MSSTPTYEGSQRNTASGSSPSRSTSTRLSASYVKCSRPPMLPMLQTSRPGLTTDRRPHHRSRPALGRGPTVDQPVENRVGGGVRIDVVRSHGPQQLPRNGGRLGGRIRSDRTRVLSTFERSHPLM